MALLLHPFWLNFKAMMLTKVQLKSCFTSKTVQAKALLTGIPPNQELDWEDSYKVDLLNASHAKQVS